MLGRTRSSLLGTLEEKLFHACSRGDIENVKYYLEQGCKINVVDLGNLTPLHMAAARDVGEVLEMLIAAGANVHHKTTDKISPLHVSASRGLLNNVRLLVEAGAHVDTLDSSDRSPLFMAVSRCHIEVVSYLLSQGAKVNIEEIHGYTPLYEAVSQKNTTIVKMLLRAGAKITQSHHLLHYAILHRHEEMVRLLISAGSIVNLRDESGDTPLILAAKTQQPNIARLLLESGAAVNYTNYITGNTALHEAIKNMRGGTQVFEEMFRIFQEHDVDLEVESESGYPALYLAIFLRQDDAAAILIRHGASVNSVFHNNPCKYNYEMFTSDLFHWVLHRGNYQLLELFIHAGYNIRNAHIPKTTTHPIERWIVHLQSNPMRLCDLCRIKVRSLFKSKVYKMVSRLPVPPAIKTFLKLEDIN
ncbi:UNVERIFIED_CONTAM: hypothetical protein PYX00_006458 [Menopon gallinae]|uniref:SOCS box domain-containing protein n=1 Tax=Menopon gallinae TaxID=328185 RepID=A0AAW2HVG1_9NEOP